VRVAWLWVWWWGWGDDGAVVDRYGEVALHQQLAQLLRQEISSGQLSCGQWLPSEPQLAARYGLARETVRKALGLLQAEGLICKRRGRGSYVAFPPD
jgi:GntR family transcriptional regulator